MNPSDNNGIDDNAIGGASDVEVIRFVVVGKSGTGKSSLCNQIVMAEEPGGGEASAAAAAGRTPLDGPFKTGSGLQSITTTCQEVCVTKYGCQIIAVDTPCTDETDIPRLIDEVKQRISAAKCKGIIVVCVRCDARYAAEEHTIYKELKKAWGDPEDFSRRLIVSFTHGDKLTAEDDEEEDEREEDQEDEKQKQETHPEYHKQQQDTDDQRPQAGNTETEDSNAEEEFDDGRNSKNRSETSSEGVREKPTESEATGDDKTQMTVAKTEDTNIQAKQEFNDGNSEDRSVTSSEDEKSQTTGISGNEKTHMTVAGTEEDTNIEATEEDEDGTSQDDGIVTSSEGEQPTESKSTGISGDEKSQAKTEDTANIEAREEDDDGNSRVDRSVTSSDGAKPTDSEATGDEKTQAERVLEGKLKATWPQLQDLMKDAHGRYVIFNNKHQDVRAERKLVVLAKEMDVPALPSKPKDKTDKTLTKNKCKETRFYHLPLELVWGLLQLCWWLPKKCCLCVFSLLKMFALAFHRRCTGIWKCVSFICGLFIAFWRGLFIAIWNGLFNFIAIWPNYISPTNDLAPASSTTKTGKLSRTPVFIGETET